MAEKTNITEEAPPETIKRKIERTRESLSETIGEIREKFTAEHWREEIKDEFRDKAGKVAARARELAGRAKESSQRAGAAVLETFWKARDGVRRIMTDDPLAVKIAAFVIGALIASAIRKAVKQESKRETGRVITTLSSREDSTYLKGVV